MQQLCSRDTRCNAFVVRACTREYAQTKVYSCGRACACRVYNNCTTEFATDIGRGWTRRGRSAGGRGEDESETKCGRAGEKKSFEVYGVETRPGSAAAAADKTRRKSCQVAKNPRAQGLYPPYPPDRTPSSPKVRARHPRPRPPLPAPPVRRPTAPQQTIPPQPPARSP